VSMSKRDYEAIAEIMNKSLSSNRIDTFTVIALAAEMAVYFAQDNSRFDIDRFLKSIGDAK
jgi:hypothetical protein